MGNILEEKVVEVISKYFSTNKNEVVITKIDGGFTGASKFILSTKGIKFFLKVGYSELGTIDSVLVEYEVKIYQFLEKFGLTGELFPKYVGYVKGGGVVVLIIDYLENVTWGGPWNMDTIEKLDEGLQKLHGKIVTDEDFEEIEKISSEVLSVLGQELHPKKLSKEELELKNKPFFDAWSVEKNGFADSHGDIYFAGDKDLASNIVEETLKDFKEGDRVLTMHDLNFANICFSDKQAYFVDPLYLKMGYADKDRLVVGVNILQQLGASVSQELRKTVVDKYIKNKMALASLIKYYVTTTAKQMGKESETFQQFHKECAIVALDLFQKWETDRF